MNKTAAIIISAVLGVFLIGGGVFAYMNSQNDKKEQDKMAMEKKSEDEAMMNKDETAAVDNGMMADGDSMMGNDHAMSDHGSYVTLADYKKDPSAYANSKKVYFFHASWCSICQGIDKEINADMSKIPSDVTLIKTDFDSSTELRQKYGVTTQYTFVQVDNDGNETAQWSATSLDKVIAGIKV